MPKASRRNGFFGLLNKEAFDGLFHYLQENVSLRFPDLQPFLRMKKEEGETLTQVMDHVVRWMNSQPVDIVGLHENNKPLRRNDLKLGTSHFMSAKWGFDWWDQLKDKLSGNGIDDAASWLDARSRDAEDQTLDYVQSHMTEFRDPSMKHYMDSMPEEPYECYVERFYTETLWADLLRTVANAIGPEFRPVWKDSMPEFIDVYEESHQSQHETHGKQAASSLTRAICSQLGNIPEVKCNPALSGIYASTELGAYIDRAVLSWATTRCRNAMESNESDNGARWSNETLHIIQQARQGYERLLSETAVTTIPANDALQQQQQQEEAARFPQQEPDNYSHDGGLQREVIPSSQLVEQVSLPQGFVPNNMANGGQVHNGGTRRVVSDGGMPRMQQQQQLQQQQQQQQQRHQQLQQQQFSQPPGINTVTSLSPRPPVSTSSNARLGNTTHAEGNVDRRLQSSSGPRRSTTGTSGSLRQPQVRPVPSPQHNGKRKR
ncbi:hypothetical protein ACHAPJ_013218 [Fusarium lateritium]